MPALLLSLFLLLACSLSPMGASGTSLQAPGLLRYVTPPSVEFLFVTLFPESSFLPVPSLLWLPSLTMGSHCLLSSCKQVGLSTAQWPRVTTQLPNSCRLLSLHKISYLSCVCSPFSKISFLGLPCYLLPLAPPTVHWIQSYRDLNISWVWIILKLFSAALFYLKTTKLALELDYSPSSPDQSKPVQKFPPQPLSWVR